MRLHHARLQSASAPHRARTFGAQWDLIEIALACVSDSIIASRLVSPSVSRRWLDASRGLKKRGSSRSCGETQPRRSAAAAAAVARARRNRGRPEEPVCPQKCERVQIMPDVYYRYYASHLRAVETMFLPRCPAKFARRRNSIRMHSRKCPSCARGR